MDSAELELLVDSGLEVQVKVETEVHCLVTLHPLPHWFPLLACLVGVRMRIGLA
jgi:hypothetical protein